MNNKVFEAHADQVLTQHLGNPLRFEDACTFEAFGPRNRPGRLAISMPSTAGRWSETDIALLKELVHYSAERRIEVIPTGFSVGYGGGALGHDINFAAALPTILSLKALGGKIIPATSMNLLRNWNLEAHDNHVFAGYAFHDQPGQISFADSTNATVGKSSIRFEGFGTTPHGHGGGCRSCQDRGISMAEILGDCITRQRAIFKAIDPEIKVMIWSDMLDPSHNARDNYYGVVGDFTGSWEHVPKDLTILCWYQAIHHGMADNTNSSIDLMKS